MFNPDATIRIQLLTFTPTSTCCTSRRQTESERVNSKRPAQKKNTQIRVYKNIDRYYISLCLPSDRQNPVSVFYNANAEAHTIANRAVCTQAAEK